MFQIAKSFQKSLVVHMRIGYLILYEKTFLRILLERILKIKGSNDENKKHVTKLENSISFETLFKQCGISADTKQQRYKARQNSEKILDFFQEQGFISGYEISRKPDGTFSIEIFF